MLKTERVTAVFDTANAAYESATRHLDEAIAELDRAELVKSVEKTWAATLQATNGLILACSGVEPKPDDERETSRHLLCLPDREVELRKLTEQYFSLTHILHDTVICDRDIEPVSVLIQDIREAADYIRDCERLALSGGE